MEDSAGVVVFDAELLELFGGCLELAVVAESFELVAGGGNGGGSEVSCGAFEAVSGVREGVGVVAVEGVGELGKVVGCPR